MKQHASSVRIGFVLFAIALSPIPSRAADVFFDNDNADLNYFNAINWSDNTTVPHGGAYSGTATISNFSLVVGSTLYTIGTNAVLRLQSGTVISVSNLVEFGVGGDVGTVGSRVIVESNAVLRGLGAPNSGTAGFISFNPGASVVPAAPSSFIELQPGAVLSNLSMFRFSQTPGDKWGIVAEGATIRALVFGGTGIDSPSFFLTNTIFQSVGGASGGSISPRMRNGQTLSYVRTTPSAPSFSLSVIGIDENPSAGTNGGHFFLSGGGTTDFNTASRLDVAIATTASGATSTVTMVNGARFRSGGVIRLGADDTQDLGDNNGSTVIMRLADQSVMRTDRYLALGSRASLSGTGTVEFVPFSATAGFFTYQTNGARFDGKDLRFLFNPEATIIATFETPAKDLGTEVVIADVTNNFFLGNLTITNASSGIRTTNQPHLRLVDSVDNALDGSAMDALYVGNLFIASNTIIDLNFKRLYYFGEHQDFTGVTFLNAPFGGPIFIPEPSAGTFLAACVVLSLFRRRR